MNKKQLPTWYVMFVENKIKKLEIALEILDLAEHYVNNGFTHISREALNKAIHQYKS